MKIVVISDLHADRRTLGVPRFDEIEAAVMQSVRHAISIGARVFVVLGDIANSDGGSDMLRAIGLFQRTAFLIAAKGISFISVAGNHCASNDDLGATCMTPLAMMNASPRIHVVESPRVIDIDNVAFACLPYTPISRAYNPEGAATRMFDDIAERRRRDGIAHIVVLSHLTVLEGVEPGEEAGELARGREVVFPLAATKTARMRIQGHFHKAGIYDPKDGGPPIHIPGALARLTHGEESHDPGFLILEV